MPKEEFWDFIISRRDLLVPDDIRERKSAFFTPQVWVQKAQEYLADALGEDWQEEYYIWDCAAGTGNLLSGLNNKYRIFASTLDKADADVMKERVENGANLLEANIFQFDFLNDEFFDKTDKGGILHSKLPQKLQEIIKNEPQKLVIINPPYAEATSGNTPSGTGQNKAKVARENMICEKYKEPLGKANNELFAQFFMRIYKEIPNCILGSFSKLKYINANNFAKFRETFKAQFLKGFICPADTFDNVGGKFPIGFLVWDLATKENLKQIQLDIFERGDNFIGQKGFYSDLPQSINKWIKKFNNQGNEDKALLDTRGVDFQNRRYISIKSQNFVITAHSTGFYITKYNLIPFCVYFAVRHAIMASWINDRDQFFTQMTNGKKITNFKMIV